MNNWQDKKVSVVIPVYNCQDYIQECLNATLLQTHQNIEVIIVNDGSIDRSIDICNKYAKRDDRIKVIDSPHAGVSITRNRGIKAATGDFITFFDSDDFPEIDLIESYLEAWYQWKEQDISFVLCGMADDNVFNTRVRNQRNLLEEARGYTEGENYVLPRSSSAMLAWLKLFNFVTNKIYDLNAIKENKIRFEENFHIGEDLKFNLDYLDAVPGQIGVVNRALYHYVKREKISLSVSYYDSGIDDTKYIYERFLSWEKRQVGATEDDILVLKAIFITDWISRLTALYEAKYKDEKSEIAKRILERDVQSQLFQKMLTEVHKAKKISTLRFLCLKTRSFAVFFFMHKIYQVMKG